MRRKDVCRVKANKKSKSGAEQKICRNPGSNQGPYDLQSYALPTELLRHVAYLTLNFTL